MKSIFKIAILLFFSSLSFNTIAQIFYQDISPDVILDSWNAKNIHIDSLSTSALSYGGAGILTIWNDFGTQIDINAFSNCEVIMNGTYPASIDYDQEISSSAIWAKPEYSILNDGSHGNWIGVTDKYLGVRVKNGTHWLYGWIRMDVNTSGTSVTIKDYSCNRTPDASILAGQTTLRIPEVIGSNCNFISIYPNPMSDESTLSFNSTLMNATISIYSTNGQLVKRIDNISGQSYKLKRSGLPAGIYNLILYDDVWLIIENKKTIIY